jgi:hypothetical protein
MAVRLLSSINSVEVYLVGRPLYYYVALLASHSSGYGALPNIDPKVQVSDTTEADRCHDAGYLKNIFFAQQN